MAKRRSANVIDLGTARSRRRLHDYDARLHAVLEQNRATLSRLFASGAIFTRRGIRAGRDLLLAHQHLLRVEALLSRLQEPSASSLSPAEVEAGYLELDALLQRTTVLTAKGSPRSATLRE